MPGPHLSESILHPEKQKKSASKVIRAHYVSGMQMNFIIACTSTVHTRQQVPWLSQLGAPDGVWWHHAMIDRRRVHICTQCQTNNLLQCSQCCAG